jgi:N-acetyl sugar amidotransferase
MNYCKLCLQPNTRPGTIFTANGVCPACAYHATLGDIDWDARFEFLKEKVAFGKQHSQSGYDCIIGVSGGKDSTRQALYVKEHLKMNPLLVCLGPPPQQVTQRGVDNTSNLIKLGFDLILINPGPETWRRLMHHSFYKYVNPFKSTELALFASVPRLAIAYQIPLIWWGENSALQLGESSVMGKDGSDGNNLRMMNTLGGGDITWMISDDIKKQYLIQYTYPTEQELIDANIRITFLGYFWKDWSLFLNGSYSALRGLEIRDNTPDEIGDYMGITALDEDWTPMNQMIKYLKFGFGRITDYVNEDIRNGRMTREEAIDLCERYDGKCSPRYIESFCQYIGISVNEFWVQVDKAVNPLLFKKIGIGRYKKKFTVGIGL